MGNAASLYSSNGHADVPPDAAMATIMGRCSADVADDGETTALLSAHKERRLTWPRRRRGGSGADSGLPALLTGGVDVNELSGKTEKSAEKAEAPIVLDAGWKNIVRIPMCAHERCPNNHPLLPNNLWEPLCPECNTCKKNIGFANGLLSCRECNWDICPACNALREP